MHKLIWTERRPKSQTKVTTKEQFAYYKDLESAERAKREISMSATTVGEVKIIQDVKWGE